MTTIEQPEATQDVTDGRAQLAAWWPRIALLAVVGTSFPLNAWQVSRQGLGNTYTFREAPRRRSPAARRAASGATGVLDPAGSFPEAAPGRRPRRRPRPAAGYSAAGRSVEGAA